MSAWVIALGLSAGYLINKNAAIKTQIETAAEKPHAAAKPATDGVTSAEVRSAYKSTQHVTYGDMNTDLPKQEMDQLAAGARRQAQEVSSFDGEAPIQGVLLHFDHLGV